MEKSLREALRREVAIGGQAYVRNLAGAETAVLQGQFNVAKILRAAGHTQWVLAMNAARLLQPRIDGPQLFHAILGELDLTDGGIAPGEGEDADAAADVILERNKQVRGQLRDILQRGLASLAANPDVLEKDVNIYLLGCYNCGYLFEGKRPAQCPLCAAPSAELAFFGPYYER